MVGPAFTISLEYWKEVYDVFGRTGAAATWSRRGSGTHGRDSSYIVAGLSELLDVFLSAYLRVNEEACG